MKKSIKGKGWFTTTISSLNTGNAELLMQEQNSCRARGLCGMLRALRSTAVARLSNKGWFTVDHPILGNLQWKEGLDFRTGRPYMFVRLNGSEILNWWPGRIDVPAFKESRKQEVINFLGRLD